MKKLILLLTIMQIIGNTAQAAAIDTTTQHKEEEVIMINAQNNVGNTPLHLATDPEIALILIQRGANVNIRNKAGETPFDIVQRKLNKWSLEQCIREEKTPDMCEKEKQNMKQLLALLKP